MQHGEAFIFGRSDWQYVAEHILPSATTWATNSSRRARAFETGNFSWHRRGRLFHLGAGLEPSAFGGVTGNGKFPGLSRTGSDGGGGGSDQQGSVRFSNCAFWGPGNQIAKIDGKGTLVFPTARFARGTAARTGVMPCKLRVAACWCGSLNFKPTSRKLRWGRTCNGRSGGRREWWRCPSPRDPPRHVRALDPALGAVVLLLLPHHERVHGPGQAAACIIAVATGSAPRVRPPAASYPRSQVRSSMTGPPGAPGARRAGSGAGPRTTGRAGPRRG